MIDLIKTRRSIRKFTDEPVTDATVDRVIEMGTWAPSGLNNQPWKFTVIRDRDLLNKLSRLTKYSSIVENAPVCIAVFLDLSVSYHREKDIQAIGACIQNMLLAIHCSGLGAVWLGEILNKRRQVEKLLNTHGDLEFMAVIALGYPGEKKTAGQRKPFEQLIVARR